MEITKDNIETTIRIRYSMYRGLYKDDYIGISYFIFYPSLGRMSSVRHLPSVSYLEDDNTLYINEKINKYTYNYIIDHIKSVMGLEPTIIINNTDTNN